MRLLRVESPKGAKVAAGNNTMIYLRWVEDRSMGGSMPGGKVQMRAARMGSEECGEGG